MQVETTITQGLADVLHGTFRLYRRTHLAHWNIRGSDFPQLHVLFEEQYTDMWEATDVLAERLRALGVDVDPSWVDATGGAVEKTNTVVKELAKDHRKLSALLKDAAKAAGDAGDTGSEDLLIGRMQVHDKFAWMLEATASS